MVVPRHNRHEQHSAASMKVVETTLNDDDINLSKQYQSYREVRFGTAATAI